MKKIIKIGVLMVALFCFSFNLQAQKYGYINSNALIEQMPAVKQLEPELASLQKILSKRRENMIADLTAKQQKAQKDLEAGLLSPAEQETLQQELYVGQQDIAKYEQTMQQQLVEKQQKLLQPILDQVNEAIKSVAKENGYTMIFDAAVLLYADESQNVDAMVKAKLGI